MKNFLLTVALILGIGACTKDKVNTDTGSLTPLTTQEKSDLLFLREEEKLARDIYLNAFRKYNVMMFSNIASSEQSHSSAVLGLLNVYGIQDPAENMAEGSFKDTVLQGLYNQLKLISDSSVNHAYLVGALIEDVDIYDLTRFQGNTSNSSLKVVYDKLACGSRNHMRSFVTQLGTYKPQYISQELYQSIINGSHESCGN